MKKKNLVIIVVMILLLACVISTAVFLLQNHDQETVHDEGTSAVENTESWISPVDQIQHTVSTYSLGTTAAEVSETLEGIKLVHKYIDDICIYEMYPSTLQNGGIVFFLHGQGSRKEEYLYDMVAYADEGYVCVTVDIEGSGERVSDEEIMSIQATVDTGEDINTLIEYYMNQAYADANRVAIIGLSQGGSIGYWYAAYGKYPLSALVVGSTTPNYLYYVDSTSIKAGAVGDSIWSEAKLNSFIKENNPVNNLPAFDSLPILSGHGMADSQISTKGDEEMELYLYSVGNKDAFYYYFDGVGHNVTEEYMQKVLPFLNKYLRGKS